MLTVKGSFFKRYPYAVFLLLLGTVIGGVGVHTAFSQVPLDDHSFSIKNTLLIYPSSVKDTSWGGVEHVLTPDLDEDAMYQHFTEQNSAFVILKEESPVLPSNSSSSDTPQTDVVQETDSNSASDTPDATGSESEDTTEVHSDDPVQGEPESQQQTETPDAEAVPVEQGSASEESEAPASIEGQTSFETSGQNTKEVTVLKKATPSLFAFFESITQYLPFTNTASVSDSQTPDNGAPVDDAPEEPVDASLPDTNVQNISTTSNETQDTAGSTEVASSSEALPEEVREVLPSNFISRSISLSDFSTPELKPGEFVTSMQLRLSLAAKYKQNESGVAPRLEISYKTPTSTVELGSIEIDEEVSNAINGGYFLFALPQAVDITDMSKVAIELTYKGDTENLDGLYLDAVWLEVNVEKVDKGLLEAKVQQDTQEHMDDPKISTLLSSDVDFTRGELPHFSLRYNSQRNIAVRFIRDLMGKSLATVEQVSFLHNEDGNVGITPKIDVTKDGLISISLSEEDKEQLKPGEYTVELTINEGGTVYKDSFAFQWGLLSINPDQSANRIGEPVDIYMGALSQNGNTVCDANLELYIIDPQDVVFKTPVQTSGLCNGNNVVDVPDYSSSFTPQTEGEYEMYLERLDSDGTVLSHTSDTFIVQESLPLSIERKGPSRIYPAAAYPMKLTVHSEKPWKGKLVEVVPSTFAISDTDALITPVGSDALELSWDIETTASGTQSVSYTFDAPDVSPFLYTVGHARLEGQEPLRAPLPPHLPVASTTTATTTTTEGETPSTPSEDGTATDINTPATTSDPAALPVSAPSAGEEVTSSSSETKVQEQEDKNLLEKILDVFHIGGEAEPESDAPAPAQPEDVNAESSELVEPQAMDQMVASSITEIQSTSSADSVVFEEHRQWQIASDATGSMIVYWTNGATVPAGWTCLSCGSGTFYQRFARGGPTYNTTGGSATHSHSASGTVGIATGASNSENNAGALVSLPAHSHTIPPNVVATSSLPAYRQLRVIQSNSAGEPASIPAGAVLMFDSTLPGGWARYTALDNRYPRGENALANAGSNTHKHRVNGTTTAASGSTVNGRTGGTQVTSADVNHRHTISTTTAAVSIEPPFITVIYATSSVATTTPTGAITMWTDTPPAQWQNESATSTDPFFDKFTKGAVTYGTTGGADTHTHANISGVVSSNAVGTHGARTGATGISNVHTHLVDVTDFTSASNLPPYITAIFARKYGAIPLYTQKKYHWYVNTNALQPTDPWPVGASDLDENEVIDTDNTAVKSGDVVRLRIQLSVSNSTSTSDAFKLQFASSTATSSPFCSSSSFWTDVGSATSSVKWRGYNNAGVADGATISSSTLAGTNVNESYEESNPSVTMPNTVGIGKNGEWDFVLQQNNADPSTNYCFRMVRSSGTPLFAYTQYPTLVTNNAPNAPILTKRFDNEKVGTTTPDFEFSGTDDESNDLTYQIQVDDNYNFSSTNIDRNSVTNATQFENAATPADKDPFNAGETIEFNNSTALTNGTTYYWRVRAKDPNGSNTYGSWSAIRSFTIDTTVTLSTWFQTTNEQFNSNTLDGVLGTTSLARLRTGSTTGTMYSTPIVFADAQVGTAWGSFIFNDTEVTSDLKYTIQYNDDDVWTDLPDAILPGNSAGFDTSPVSLLGVDKTIYDQLRIKATLVNSGASPTLLDWTVTWGYLIETPTINAPFANEKVSTTTPTFEFTTTDPQNDSLQYQIQWSTTYAFTASTTRNSNVNPGFTNITTPADTDPFNSGDVIQFKVQPAQALTNGTTYWWRVRARDPGGSNTYSFFTVPRSITVDTSVTVSTWFQTTQSQFSHDTLSNGFARSTDVATVATTTQASLIAYGEGNITTPKYRTWNGTTWSSQADALTVGATIAWTVTKASPIKSEYILATMGTDADVNVQVYSNGVWGNLQEVTPTIPSVSQRGFDVAYEQSSGDAMVVTCDGDANPTYYIWNGSTWTNGGAIGLTGGNTCGWVKLISNPTSDEIIAITRDTSGITYEARVWSGSAWGNSTTWGSMNQATHEGIAAAYEESGNQAVVAVSNGTAASFSWRAWNGTTWSAATAVALGDDFEAGTMASDKGSDNLAFCYIDEDGDLGALRWTGAAWAAVFVELETAWTTAMNAYADRPIDCAFEVGGARDGFITAVYSDLTNLRYRTWNGGAWVAEASVSTIARGPRVQVSRTADNLLQALEFATSTDSYRYSYWNGTAWSAQQTIEADASVGAVPYKEPFMIAPANPTTVGTVVGDPVLNFYEGSGPYWKQMSWNDTTTGGSDILYQVEYYDGSTWQLVPDSLIPGNSAGTTTSPINLSNVLPVTTYNMIRPVANMTCHLGTCPSLSDWNITWSAGITITGTAKQYDQTTDVTSGTVAVALNGVLQVGKTGTIAAGAWSIANVNASPGDTLTFFVTGATDAAEAVAVTKYDGVGDMAGVNLYQRHISIGSDDLATVSNADLAKYDFTNTEDIFYDVNAGSDLSACATTGCNDAELIIKALNTYQSGSGADIATHDFENNGIFKLNGNLMRVGGSWDNNATTSLATSTVIFNATSTSETIDETGSVLPIFNNMTLGQSTSTATWSTVTNLDINGNFTVAGGTFARGARTLNLAGNLLNASNGVWTGIGTTTFDGTVASTWTDQSVALQNIGKVVVDGTNKSITLGSNVKARSLKIGSDDTFDASVSGYSITVYTNWVNGNIFTARTGTVLFAATTTNRIITAGGSNFYNLSFNGLGGAWSFTNSTLNVDNDFAITAGTVTMPTATTTIAGSFTNAGTFVHNNSLINFTTTGSKSVTLAGTPLTNAFYNVRFSGSGSWTFTDANATTTNTFRITNGNVTLPSNTLTVGDTFTNPSGSFTHNNGTVKFTNTGTRVIDPNSSFYSLRFSGAGSSFSFLDSSVTALGNLTVSAGTLTLPSGTMSIGGSVSNTATIAHNNGTVLFNSTDTGETVSLGNSSLYNMTFNSATGGWTVSADATSTNNTTLTALNSFTLSSGKRLSVGGTFSNNVGGAGTTWTGSTLVLQAGNYSLNNKTDAGDAYNILSIKASTNIKMWNSSAGTYAVNAAGSLYSQDHNAVDGDLYVFGAYTRNSGTEYWSYANDFDGTSLGTTSRRANVKFASGASANFTTSVLNMTGIPSATTTVTNQGAGTYVVGISGGTTTASYYSFANLGASGLSLLASNKVTSLAHGAFNISTAGGTSITVSSTTIAKNPALQILSVNFSTTSPVVATNVTQTDGTPASYWWFRNSTGNFDGEAHDFDTGNPGSIRWDDSSLVFTVSGKVFTDAGVTALIGGTCNGIATPVRVKVKGGSTYDGSCSAVNGTYSIAGVTAVGDAVVTVFLNGASGGQKAVAVTKTPTGDISGMDLYANRVITRHQDVAPMTIADMADYDSTDDTDIMFTAATGTTPILTTFPNTELFLWATSTFNPGGTVTLRSGGTGTSYDGSLHIKNGATFVGAGTTTYSVGGTFALDTKGTFTPASSTVKMTATTSGKAITTGANSTSTFSTLRFTGVNGAWNINGNISASTLLDVATGTVTGTGNIYVSNGSFSGNGTVSLGSGTTTIAKTNTLGGTRAWTFGNLVLGNGLVVGTTTVGSNATTTVSGKLTIANAHNFKARGSRINLSGSGNVFLKNGNFIQGTSTVRYSGTAATNVISANYYNLYLMAVSGSPTYTGTGLGLVVSNDLAVGSVATTTANFTTSDPALDVNGSVTIASRSTLIGSDSGPFTVAGSWTNGGTFTSSAGTVTFDGSGSPTINAGNSSFGNVAINGTGSFTISQNATATAAFSLTSATAFTLSSGKTLAVGGVFTNSVGGAPTTWTGSTLRLYSGTNYQINPKTVSDTYDTLLIGSNTNIRMWNSGATTYTLGATGSIYSQDHGAADGALNIYGTYPGNGSTDYWSYATDFDGASLGSTSRQANIRFASGASATYVNGGLSILGVSNASTTLQNQGAGTYALRIGGSASTTWSYYDVKNTNSAGITFSGTPNVVNISRGAYEVTVGAGSAITVGGSVINANPARTFTNNRFATTTAIAAFNVTATGTSVSSWRFTNHAGNLAGEAKDSDPAGDPGYIVWDDSASSVTISGKVYSDEGVTVSTACNGVTNDVRLEVAGLTSYVTNCNAGSGLYTIPGVTFSPGDSLVVYIDGVAQKGATVSEDLVTGVANMDIYENRVIVRQENTDPLSIADMAVWSSTNDADIPFTAVDAATDTLTLPANRKLLVWTGKEFRPGGNVTVSGGGAGAAYDGTLEAQTNSIVTFANGEQHSIGGSFVFGTGATFTAGQSTTTFTTTGAARTIDINNQTIYNTAFTGSGSWTITDSTFTLRSARISAGTLTLPTGTTTVSGSWNTVGGSFTVNGSPMVFTSTSAGNIVRTNGSNLKTVIFNGVGGTWNMTDTNATATAAVTILKGSVTLPSGVFTVGGSFRNQGGSIVHNTSELFLTSTTSANLLASTSDLFAVTFKGTGPFTMKDRNATLLDDFRILQGSVLLATGTLSVGGSWTTTGGTFTSASGTVLFNASATGKTVTPGTSNFYDVVFGGASGGWTIAGDATTTHNFTLSAANSFTLGSGRRLSVGNVFTNSVGGAPTTWTGSTLALRSGNTFSMNTKSAGGDNYQTLTIAANTHISMWNSKATTTTMKAVTGSVYSQDHGSVDGALNIYGDYHISTTTRYWSYATDFDGTALGGSPRNVTVSIAANATTTVDGGALNIVGTSGHETTITNQGSGTYSFKVSSGSFNGQYYRYRNLNSTGLSFTGSPVVYSLAQGDFELAVAGGTLIRVSSTTLNANASLVISGNRFATTTAITGVNVRLVGTTSNAWTFNTHTGNLAGEKYDVDGGSLCGSIRWSDSSCLLTQQTHYRWRNDDGNIFAPNNEWMNASWTARQRVRLQNPDATTYTNAVVKVHVVYDGDMQTDFDDLRFTDQSGTTTLKYFVERYTASTDADVWVKVPTLAASQTTTLFMYYKNASIGTVSSSTQTFLVADDFETGNKARYSGDTSLFTVDGTFAYGGSYGLDTTGNESARATNGIARTDVSVAQGQIIRYLQYVDTGAGSGDEACTMFAVQSPVTLHHNYGVCLEQFGTDRMSLVKNVVDTDSSGSLLASTSVSYSTGWYEVQVDWQTSNKIGVTLRKNGSFVASTSATDSTYTSGGIGFTYWFQNGGWDNYTSRNRVANEPTVRFGAEQGRGGATWKAAVDTAASYATGDIARIRFSVENTGLVVNNQTYDLEFAAQGAAPSCEAVSSGSYVHLPVQGSCGSSALCMQNSANVTDNTNASDLLFGPQINFTLGKAVESPSYTTSPITLNQNDYTELEYAITPTVNATAPNYCLRVTNAGTPVDTYLQVAKLNMRFDPTVTGVSLNSGSDISLTPGATTTVFITGTATDLNGYTDLLIASSTIYRSGAGPSCSLNNNSCYKSSGSPKCTYSSCVGNSCTVSCKADIYYHADATDNAPYAGENWLGFIEAKDQSGGIGIGSASGVEMLTLRALNVSSAIAYGSLAVSSTTGSFNPTSTVQNLGNSAIDVNVLGTDLSDGASSKIPATREKYSTSTFTYTGCVTCTTLSSTTPAHLEVDLTKPTSTGVPVTDIVYWGIAIPFGVSSRAHYGTNTFYAVSD